MVVVNEKKSWAEEVERKFTPKPRKEELSLSVIIPTYNCSVSLDLTLSTISNQNYQPLEVIVIDAGSTDKTHDILAQYGALITRVYTVSNYNIPEMINRASALASGEYITTVYPNCFYTNKMTFDIFAEAALDHKRPDLVICNSIVEAKLPLVVQKRSPEMLKRGLSPNAFAACWFKKDFFVEMGKLDPQYKLCFAFDFFCRISKKEGVREIRLDRTLLDHSRTKLYVEYGWDQVKEIGKILKHHFGLRVFVKWLLTLRFSLLLKLLCKNLKEFFFEKS